MNPNKDRNYKLAVAAFQGLTFSRLNNDMHWKIGKFNFFPTTHRWNDNETGECGQGIEEALEHLKADKPRAATYRTVEQLFEIAKRSNQTSLFGICEAIHKEIYQ